MVKMFTFDSRLAHRERFWKFVAKHEQWFKGKHNLVYDDSHLLYTFQPLDFEKSDLKELVITEKTELVRLEYIWYLNEKFRAKT